MEDAAGKRRRSAGDGLSRASGRGAVQGVAPAVWTLALCGGGLAGMVAWVGLGRTLSALHVGLFLLFLSISTVRLVLPARGSSLPPTPDLPDDLPWYTVIVPLRDEAAMAVQIVGNLGRLNYPPDRMQILFVVEADDLETRAAILAADPPRHMHVLVCPPGAPATKPRACNLALSEATGDIVVIFDAEDQPDRLQLLEAAARFSQASPRLGCLQAPLRIVERADPLGRQFALEYAAQFEVVMPALSSLGLPFALGGTSNHFRRAALEDVGGWDAFNVTEDADIGLRLAARGWTLGVLQAPTWEEAPESLEAWLPQRARWLKGYVQTWSVAMRRPFAGGLRRFLGLQATLGLSLLSSLAHGPLALLVGASGIVALLDLHAAPLLVLDAELLAFAWASAALIMAVGARRAGFRMTVSDALRAGGYWPTLSLAGLFALHQLVTAPFHWDKTPHQPHDLVADAPFAAFAHPDDAYVSALDADASGWITRTA